METSSNNMSTEADETDINTLFDTIIFPFYFWIYLFVTMFSQISVMLLITFKTPSFFKDFRIFLINSSSLQIAMCLIIFFTQVRPLPNPNSSGYLFSGSCRFIHKNACFFSFDIFQLVFDASAFAIPATLFYKYSKVTKMNGKEMSRLRVRLILVSSYFLSFIVGLIYIITYNPSESLDVSDETKKQYRNKYEFSHYAEITGYRNHIWSTLTNNLNLLSIYIPPIMSIIFIRLIHVKLSSFKHLFTDKTAAQARRFDLALTIQTLVPAICIIPVYTLHLISEGFHLHFTSNFEKILYIMLALPTAIDAFIVIFTITPYRKSFLSFLNLCKKPLPTVPIRGNNSRATSLF